MRQYDVCRLKRKEQLVVVLQHDVTDELATRIVAPMAIAGTRSYVSRIRVPIEVKGESYLVCLDLMAAIDKSEIGNIVGNIGETDIQIKAGLDFQFFGI